MGTRRRAALAAALFCSLAAAAPASAAGPPALSIEDGVTQPVFDYEQAIRERVYIPQPGIDQDRDGKDDRIAADIIRPKESGSELAVPAIIDPSPYYTTLCRGNEQQCMRDYDGDGVNDKWPLFYDNYFVPRGYAYVCAQMNGTGFSTGCPYHGGPTDIAGEKSVIDWLGGRVPGDNQGVENVTAAVFATHGFQDDNVRLNHLSQWWEGPKASGCRASCG
jgi:X-Pro dipeptidyl-peptidase